MSEVHQDSLFNWSAAPRSRFDPKDPMSTNERAFWAFHEQHPEFYRSFDHFAGQLLRAGRTYGSAYLICERIRWDTILSGADVDGFKINNNHRPYYARLWMQENPQHPEFFHTREIRN